MMRPLRPFIGSLVVLPIAVLLWGTTWEIAGWVVDQRWLPPIIWGVWLLLRWLTASSSRSAAAGVLRAWSRFEPFVSGVLLYAVLFRSPTGLVVPLLIWLALVAIVVGLRRAQGALLLTLAVAFGVFGIAVPRAFKAALLARIAATYQTDVDHRMWPDGKEINSDGARFRGEPEDLADDDFVILFLGDSFTYGFNLFYEDAYPYVAERIFREADCDANVRAVDFGWTSSSPLLGLRLLRQVGFKYRPDLIVYGLDMTDFHDDLRYELKLREQNDYAFDQSAILERLISTRLPWAVPAMPLLRAITDRLRSSDDGSGGELIAGLAVPGPNERYFATNHPLDVSRSAIELGVMKNLAEIERYARDLLGVGLVVAVLPRSFQYSDRESPRNWEANEYEPLGPYVREPFRYFEQVAPTLPYPVVSLLSAFAESDEFPLYLPTDPHWNERGAALAGRTIARALAELQLIPCEVD
jgi:hypothetical protein